MFFRLFNVTLYIIINKNNIKQYKSDTHGKSFSNLKKKLKSNQRNKFK